MGLDAIIYLAVALIFLVIVEETALSLCKYRKKVGKAILNYIAHVTHGRSIESFGVYVSFSLGPIGFVIHVLICHNCDYWTISDQAGRNLAMGVGSLVSAICLPLIFFHFFLSIGEFLRDNNYPIEIKG